MPLINKKRKWSAILNLTILQKMFSGGLKTLFWVEYTNTNKLTGSCSVQPSTFPDTCYSIVMHIVVRKQW